MRPTTLVSTICLAALTLAAPLCSAQERIWRCGNEYTNDANSAQARGCRQVEGGNITVIEGTRPASPAATAAAPGRPVTAPPAAPVRVDPAEQRNRDNEARSILEAELRKAEARRADLVRQYNNGEPEKQGSEARNYQKYLDRVAEMKSSLTRVESDIAGLRRELSRLPAAR